MTLTLEQLNAAPPEQALAWLAGVYEHSPWIAEAAIAQRPFASLAHLKLMMANAVREAGRERQLALVRAHPELAGKAMVAGTLTAESKNEQAASGLANCTPEEFAKIQQLNADYNAKFGWPFILAVRGPRGLGLTRREVIAVFERRLQGHPDFELAECLRNVHRIAELRLDDKFGVTPELGNLVWDWAESLAQHSDPGYAQAGQLTVTYLTDAHRACARQLVQWMQECGFDEVGIDAVGNVVGVYHAAGPHPSPTQEPGSSRRPDAGAPPTPVRTELVEVPAQIGAGASFDKLRTVGDTGSARTGGDARVGGKPRLLAGSHYDTVRNGGKYDGRLGIFVPMACVRELHREGRRLPFGIEVVGFAEEEGQRYKATFLGSGALVGQFNAAWLDQQDADGVTMREAMQRAGLTIDGIPALKRDPARYLGFVEVHIEQGPVLNEIDMPLGVVTSINGGVRYLGEMIGMASHAGTTPMDRRRDAATGVAELALFVERRAASEPDVVGTVGMLEVPNGSINVVPGRCRFSLDLRATTNDKRDRLTADVLAELKRIAERRGLHCTVEETMRASAAPSAPAWQARWEQAVQALGLPVFRMPSGAGHDAMKLHEVMPQAMLFLRGGNAGISHNPLETITNDDADLCVGAFQQLLEQLATP